MTTQQLKTAFETASTTAGANHFLFGHIWEYNNQVFDDYPALLVERFVRPIPDQESRVSVTFNFFVFSKDYLDEEDNTDIPDEVRFDSNDVVAKAFRDAINSGDDMTITDMKADDGNWKSINDDIGTMYTATLIIYC